jgi:hypothetical protein
VRYDKARKTIVNGLMMALSDITRPSMVSYAKKPSTVDKEAKATRKRKERDTRACCDARQ